MSSLSKAELEQLITIYKSIGYKIIDKLNDDYYEDLEGLFLQRGQCLEKLSKITFNKNELKEVCTKAGIGHLDEEIKNLISFKKTNVLDNMKKLNNHNKTTVGYKKTNPSNQFKIFNVEL